MIIGPSPTWLRPSHTPLYSWSLQDADVIVTSWPLFDFCGRLLVAKITNGLNRRPDLQTSSCQLGGNLPIPDVSCLKLAAFRCCCWPRMLESEWLPAELPLLLLLLLEWRAAAAAAADGILRFLGRPFWTLCWWWWPRDPAPGELPPRPLLLLPPFEDDNEGKKPAAGLPTLRQRWKSLADGLWR